MRNLIIVLGSLFFSISGFAQTENTPDITNPQADKVDEIIIIGEQTGPSLWKVYKDDHVLWILGTFSPLPKKLQWRSQQAEDAIAQSQEVFLPPQAIPDMGFLKQLTFLPALIGLKKSPDGTLQEKVPADVYAHWLELKEKYIGKDKGVEKYRPIFAGNELREQAQKKAGFDNDDKVLDRVKELAKKHKVKMTVPTVHFPMNDPAKTLKNFKQSEIDDSLCFSQMLDHLTTDLDNMRLRANAWATGDLAALSSLPVTDPDNECWQAFMNSSFVENDGIKDLPAKVEAEWFADIDAALTNNTSSFAVVPVKEMLNKENIIAKLKAKGYRIEGFGFDSEKVE